MQYNGTAVPWVGTVTGWGAEQLTREELLKLGTKLRSAWSSSVRQANRSPGTGHQVRQSLAVASEICGLWGEAADELIVRRERAAQAQGAAAVREAEAGS